MIPEPRREHVDQPPPMLAFFCRHVIKYRGGRGIFRS
jgi:hypothetical protein